MAFLTEFGLFIFYMISLIICAYLFASVHDYRRYFHLGMCFSFGLLMLGVFIPALTVWGFICFFMTASIHEYARYYDILRP